MKTHIAMALAIAAAAGVPAAARAQAAFEGVVTFNLEGGRGPATMQYSIRGRDVRMDMSMGGMEVYTLFNGDTKTMNMVMPMRQMYMEYSAAGMQGMADSAARPKITWTGQKETIAGYTCEHATITAADGTATDVCLAKGLGTFVPAGGGRGGRGRGAMSGGWESAVGDAFPLKVQQGGRVIMEATKIEKKSLDPSLFKIPDGYQKMGMGMGGMGMGRRGGGGGR
ncbi:MAG: DUF4412 domain-containing protein [Gemmatimonadota bacterium]|nr:DUF4412 domain-containing protein [Gemmatimonadota bacterium]